jgi:hypothetical protein
MGETSVMPCWLAPDRSAAESAVVRLREAGIEAEIVAPSGRYHAVGSGRWELRVPAALAARANAILNGAA